MKLLPLNHTSPDAADKDFLSAEQKIGLTLRIEPGKNDSLFFCLCHCAKFRLRVSVGLRVRVRVGFRLRIRVGFRVRVSVGLRVRVRVGFRLRIRVGFEVSVSSACYFTGNSCKLKKKMVNSLGFYFSK